MAVKNLIFDIGGVLVGYRSPEMLAEHGVSQEKMDVFFRDVYKDPLWREFDLENISFDEVVELYVKKYPQHEELTRWVFAHTEQMPVFWTEVWEKVRALKACGKYKLYLLSNYSSVFFKNHLEDAWVIDEMDGGVISYQVHQIKPQADIYRTLLERYALEPSECVFFDDRSENIETAKRLGMHGFVITSRELIAQLLDGYLYAAETAQPVEADKLSREFCFRAVSPEEGETAARIEQICFPPNEACTPERMKMRTVFCGDTFLVAEHRQTGEIVGFINGLATNETVLRDEFFTDVTLHDPKGSNVMILGLDVLPKWRRQGIAGALVAAFAGREKEKGRARLVLTCLPEKIGMYEKFGFRDLGLSDSAWGGEAWHEMDMPLR